MENEVPQVLTTAQAGWNAGVAALVAFVWMYAQAYRRVGADDFYFFPWLAANRNRWLNGTITLGLLTALTLTLPEISDFSDFFGISLNAKLPLPLGIGLAAWMSLTTKPKDPPPPASPLDPIP
jgi:hypothetical protein